MGRVGRLGALSLTIALTACGSTEEAGETLPPVTEATKQEVDEILAHLNNQSRSERWLNALVDVGQQAPQNRKYVIEVAGAEYARSVQRNGRGPGVLKWTGRRRILDAIGHYSDGPDSRRLLKSGLDDPVEACRASAAAGLASAGDASALPILVELALGAKDDTVRDGSLQSLRRLATPERQRDLLNALTPEAQELLEPIVLKTFPSGAGRAPALREVAGGHASPYARAFALRVLTESGDPQLQALAQKALDSGDPVLRPVALAALGSSGGSNTSQIEDELRSDPDDPEAVVKGLYKAGSLDALQRAVDVLTDADLQPATRAAVAKVFLARVGHPKGAQAYRGDEALRITRDGLRAVLEREAEGLVAVASIGALGRVGEPGIDGEILLDLLGTPDEEVGRAVVAAMGRLGGEICAAKLVELIDMDPTLRGAAGDALAKVPGTRDVPMDMLIELLIHPDLEARQAAIAALSGINGDDAMGYDAEGSDGEREASMERWQNWWAARSE
jgi:HEAT repeat protein